MKHLKHPPLDDTATDVETLQFLFCLIEYMKPLVIVESGTYKAHFVLFALAANPSALIFTADPRQYHEKTVKEMAKINDLPTDNIIEFRGTFIEMLAQNPHLAGSINLAFIDSGPPYGAGTVFTLDEATHKIRWQDYQAVKNYMAYNGIIISHDMNQCGWPGHREILDEGILLPGGRGITLHTVRIL